MAVKPPRHIDVSVDVHTPSRLPVSGGALDRTPRIDVGRLPSVREPARADITTIRTDLDAILPAPAVTISEQNVTIAPLATPAEPPFERYLLSARVTLPNADADGLRVYKGRHYVDLSDGRIAQVALDPDTGLYRARLSSELTPSGPILMREPDSGVWQPRADLASIIFPLSASRLDGFRTDLDFADVEPDADGLIRHDKKLYVVIQEQTYQVLHDLDASSPQIPVMRIVRVQDPVALDAGNVYVATRPGRSEAVVLDPQEGWVGVNVAGAGGMRRSEQEPSLRRSLSDRFSALVHRPRRPEQRVRKLYSSFDDQRVASYLESLGDDINDALARKEAEYKNLKRDLLTWTQSSALISHASQTRAKMIAQEIKRSWRHETEGRLKLPVEGTRLPALTADFSHIHSLELSGVAWSGVADSFLRNFTGLEHLAINRCGLEVLPDAVGKMHRLTVLDLDSNNLQLDITSAGRISALGHLESLVLSNNVVGVVPDVSGMPGLKTLGLNNTGIEQWPSGLRGPTALELVDLRNNRLQGVPQTHLNPPDDQLERIAGINRHTLLTGNPELSGQWLRFELFWQRLEQTRPELAIGGLPGSFRIEDGSIAQIARLQHVFPDLDSPVARKYLLEFGDSMESELALLDRLDTQLKEYLASTDQLLPSLRKSAHAAAGQIKRSVLDRKHTATLALDLNSLRLEGESAPLPNITADFSHVQDLSLAGVEWTGAADAFLSGFPNLQTLTISHSTLKKLPDNLPDMRGLTLLNLSSNKIELDHSGAAALATMSQLNILDLSHNPLQITPDFSAMTGLNTLDLSHTGISLWPSGLQDNITLTRLDLRNNRLQEVPPALINPTSEQLAAAARLNGATLLSGNEFPADYWQTFDSYWRRLSTAHPDLMATADHTVFDSDNSLAQRFWRLFPSKSIKECREFIWGLEQDAGARLNQLEQDFSVLKHQLEAWVFTGGNNRLGYVRADQLAINAWARNDRTEAKNRIISCWRRETPQMLAFDRTPIGLELDLSGLRLQSLPDIEVDFSHVGSLKLGNMGLSTSPESFLNHFRHVRWLDMANNQLRDLPPTVEHMNGLTRLFLQSNQIVLTVDTARILSERTTLRALSLHENPQLGITPDFSRIIDMRSLNLANTGITTFPIGLMEQPLLDTVILSNNRIEEIPGFAIEPVDSRLAHTVRVNNVTNISNNPLSDATHARLSRYNQRLIEAETPLTGRFNLISTSGLAHVPPPNARRRAQTMMRWTAGLSAEEVSARRTQWQTLKAEPGSDGLFNTLERLLPDTGGSNGIQNRVWRLIDSITENTERSESLRREVFDRAGDATCCDRAAFTFANLETQVLVYHAVGQASDKSQGQQLAALSKALFRLHEVDKIASADIAQREAAITASRSPEEAASLPLPHVPEEVEIRLFYRYRLKDRLLLPGQPERMAFERLAEVSDAQLEAAYQKVIALDDSPEEFQELVSRDFWQKFITHKHQDVFVRQRQPFQDRQATLDESHATRELPLEDYNIQSNSLQASWMIEEATLIETLTRQELAEYSASRL